MVVEVFAQEVNEMEAQLGSVRLAGRGELNSVYEIIGSMEDDEDKYDDDDYDHEDEEDEEEEYEEEAEEYEV